MSEHEIVNHIRSVRRLSARFQRLSKEGRRRVLFIADGDTWHIDEIIEQVLGDERPKVNGKTILENA